MFLLQRAPWLKTTTKLRDKSFKLTTSAFYAMLLGNHLTTCTLLLYYFFLTSLYSR